MNRQWMAAEFWDPDALALYRESQATGISRICGDPPQYAIYGIK